MSTPPPPTFLSCGHTASSVTSSGLPSCPICSGLTHDAIVPVPPPPLLNRTSVCDCTPAVPSPVSLKGKGNYPCSAPSSLSLPFFCYRGPGSRFDTAHPHPFRSAQPGGYSTDSHYCGCRGWD